MIITFSFCTVNIAQAQCGHYKSIAPGVRAFVDDSGKIEHHEVFDPATKSWVKAKKKGDNSFEPDTEGESQDHGDASGDGGDGGDGGGGGGH